MKQLKPYLIFDGNCREAMTFYKECLNGEITIMKTFGESPIEVPEEATGRIFNSEVQAENINIMASDNLPNVQTEKGKNFALFAIFSDVEEMERIFEKLSENGKILFPLENKFGMLTDKYGIQWMLESK